jgi:CheY-like chemotaxis protein
MKEYNDKNMEIKHNSSNKKRIENILVVDDEEPVRKLFKEALERFGYEVVVASDGKEGMKLFKEHPADLIITDIFMPEKDGHDFIFEIKQEFPAARIFAITGKKSFNPQIELDIAKLLGAIRVFSKPCKLSDLLDAIEELSV